MLNANQRRTLPTREHASHQQNAPTRAGPLKETVLQVLESAALSGMVTYAICMWLVAILEQIDFA